MIPAGYASLTRMVDRQLAVFPEHQRFLETRFSGVDEPHLQFSDWIAGLIERIAGDNIDVVCSDYRWLSQMFMVEEIQFRRTGKYRYSTFVDAERLVYSDFAFMTRYMNGLLASQLWWRNHTDILWFFRETFLPGIADASNHLEIGPGHGLLLHLAASSGRCASAEGWDVSQASIAGTEAALAAMGTLDRISLRQVDMFAGPPGQYSSITFSEVLEHLDQPVRALEVLHRLLAPGGKIFINSPANAPAPDHIYLFNSPEEVQKMVEDAGFIVTDRLFAPSTGSTLERARKAKFVISAALVATKP